MSFIAAVLVCVEGKFWAIDILLGLAHIGFGLGFRSMVSVSQAKMARHGIVETTDAAQLEDGAELF